MKFIRKTESGLEGRIQSYVNIDGKTITTVGAMHVATPDSWIHLLDYLTLASDKGAAIHLEGVRPVPTDIIVSERDKNGITVMTNLISLGKSIAELTGLQYQKDAFKDAPKWDNYDLTLLDIVREMDDKIIKFIGETPLDSIKISPKRAIWSLYNVNKMKLLSFLFPSVKKLFKTLIDSRNVFAVNKAIEAETDVVLLWGAAHLDGMHKILVTAGFTPSDTEWRIIIPSGYEIPEEKANMQFSPAYKN